MLDDDNDRDDALFDMGARLQVMERLVQAFMITTLRDHPDRKQAFEKFRSFAEQADMPTPDATALRRIQLDWMADILPT